MAQALPFVAAAITVVSGVDAAGAAIRQGRILEGQADMNAVAEGATAQRKAIEEKRKAELVKSAVTARAAADGGDTTDPGVQDILSGIDAEGELRALQAISEGDIRALDWRTKGKTARANASATARSAVLGSAAKAATALSGGFGADASGSGLTMHQKYASAPGTGYDYDINMSGYRGSGYR